MTKYLEESDTGSIAIPGYVSMGHFAKSSPLFLSSSFNVTSFPFATNLIRPVHDGSARFQSAALTSIIKVTVYLSLIRFCGRFSFRKQEKNYFVHTYILDYLNVEEY